ncbi:hypothetical protein C0991_007769 [Blastosporella zonata]|nr:hypothetical protein C0991_007769 [Blastosporella zonata]
MNADVSRATSVSRASRQGSTLSRNQSLIKKNIAPHDLHPSDVLIERFVAWKAIVKQLIAYFEGIADIENNTAKELTRLGGVIQVPFRSGNQFLGEGGLQDVYFGIRDNTRAIADQHANLGRTIDSSIVQHLQKLRTEIKAHIKNVQNDTGKLATNVAKERELSTRLVAELSSNISNYKNRPMSVTHRTDPYVTNAHAASQLRTQLHAENLLQKSIIIMQQNSAHFEEGIVRSLQSAWATYTEWSSRSSISISSTTTSLAQTMAALAPDREWISFAARADHLLDPDTPLRDPAAISYPSKDDPSVLAVHTGYLERKKRFTRAYRENYFVLTAAGFLHSYSTPHPGEPGSLTPVFSLFLPMCTLGPPSGPNAASHKFHIEESKDGLGTTKAGGFKALRLGAGGGAAGHAWSFRARSREDMMEWWNDIRMLCARYLVASEHMERSGPVAAAIRSVGYETEEEEGEEEEEEGSSVEEEDEDEHEHEHEEEEYEHEAIREENLKPGVEMGAHGYAIDNKPKDSAPESLLPPDTTTNPDVDGGEHTHTERRQEKAPEGRAPHSHVVPTMHPPAEPVVQTTEDVQPSAAEIEEEAAAEDEELYADAPAAPATDAPQQAEVSDSRFREAL